jgi:hypothetical protein
VNRVLSLPTVAAISPEGAEADFTAAWMRTMALYYQLPGPVARRMALQGLELLQDVLCAMWDLGEAGDLAGE